MNKLENNTSETLDSEDNISELDWLISNDVKAFLEEKETENLPEIEEINAKIKTFGNPESPNSKDVVGSDCNIYKENKANLAQNERINDKIEYN